MKLCRQRPLAPLAACSNRSLTSERAACLHKNRAADSRPCHRKQQGRRQIEIRDSLAAQTHRWTHLLQPELANLNFQSSLVFSFVGERRQIGLHAIGSDALRLNGTHWARDKNEWLDELGPQIHLVAGSKFPALIGHSSLVAAPATPPCARAGLFVW